MKDRYLKKATSIILALSLVLGAAAGVFAADRPKNKTPLKYVALGASNTTGYGLEGYLPEIKTLEDKDTVTVYGYRQLPRESYVQLVANGLELEYSRAVETRQLGMCSMRADELRYLLDENYNKTDAYSRWRFTGKDGWFYKAAQDVDGDISTDPAHNIATLRNSYRTAVKEADVITVEIGINNFAVYLANQISDSYYDTPFEILTASDAVEDYQTVKAKVKELLAENGVDAADLTDYEKMVDDMAYAYIGFCSNFNEAMKIIRDLNPDAVVTVIGMYNIMEGVKCRVGNNVLPFGDIYGALLDMANLYMAAGCEVSDWYHYASLRENGRVELFLDELTAYRAGHPETLNHNTIDCFNLYDNDFHIGYQLSAVLNGGDPYAEVPQENLNKAYDVLARTLRFMAETDIIDMEAITSSVEINGKGAAGQIRKRVTELALGYATGAVREEDLGSAIAAIFTGEDDRQTVLIKSVAAIEVRINTGNSFFAHPSVTGHKQIAKKVEEAVREGITGKEAIAKDLLKLAAKMASAVSKYGPEVVEDFYDYAVETGVITREKLAVRRLAEAAVKDLLAAETDSERLEICKELLEDIYYTLEGEEIEITFDMAMSFFTEAIDRAAEFVADAKGEEIVKKAAEKAVEIYEKYAHKGITWVAEFAAKYVDADYRQTFLNICEELADKLDEAVAESKDGLPEKAWNAVEEIEALLLEKGVFTQENYDKINAIIAKVQEAAALLAAQNVNEKYADLRKLMNFSLEDLKTNLKNNLRNAFENAFKDLRLLPIFPKPVKFRLF